MTSLSLVQPGNVLFIRSYEGGGGGSSTLVKAVFILWRASEAEEEDWTRSFNSTDSAVQAPPLHLWWPKERTFWASLPSLAATRSHLCGPCSKMNMVSQDPWEQTQWVNLFRCKDRNSFENALLENDIIYPPPPPPPQPTPKERVPVW